MSNAKMIAKATQIAIELTTDDGRTRRFVFKTTDTTGSEIIANLEVNHDIRETTDFELDTFRRYEPTGTSNFTLEASGRLVEIVPGDAGR